MEFKEITSLIWNNEVEKFKELVNGDVNYYIYLEDSQKKTLLSHTASNGNYELTKFLVELGADINHKDNYDYTPIYLATYNTSLDIIEYLLNLGADVNIFPKYSSYGIIGELSREPKATKLLKKIIDKTNKIEGKDLGRVLNRKNIELAKYIIEKKGVTPQVIVDSIREFLYGENKNPIEFMDYLLDNKYIDVNEKNTYGETLFKVVIDVVNNNKIPKYLIEKGVDLSLNDNGKNALFSMANKNCFEGVKYFVEQGIDINSISSYNQNALHHETLRYLGYNPKKETALSKTFEYLVNNGIDIAVLDNGGKLPIHNLQYYKRTFSVKYLYEKTINAILEKNMTDEDKFNALFSLQEIAGDKKEKEMLINAFIKFPDFSDKFISELNNAKTKLREFAVKVLIKLEDENHLKALKDRSEVEDNKSLLKIIKEYLETKKDLLETKKEVIRNPKDYKVNTQEWFDVVAENEDSNIPIPWLKIDSLPEVRWSKNNEILDIKTIKYFLKLLMNNLVSDVFLNLINVDDLVELFESLHVMPPKINKDDMWIYNILFMLAEKDSKYIEMITSKLEYFVNYARRWAMGAKLLYPLSEMKNIDGVKKVDWYSRKFKHKGIKNDATSALNRAARKQNLTIEEFRDTLISDFGFNLDKELTLDYGTRKIIVKLMPDFKFTFKDEEGKSIKTLPKPNKKDDEKIAEKSIKFFKSMKKEINDILKIQTERLEYAFKYNKLSNFSYWSNFFVKNPVLNTFASNLFWGVYDNKGKLKQIFRYNEDHSFSDINDDEIKLNDKDQIGLIHPLELSNEELDKIKELISDYEITQPLEQIYRKFYVTDSKEKELNDFKDLKFYTKSTHYKLLGLGWERGYIVDNGWFEDYNMNIKELGLSASLEFSGADMYLEYMDDPSTWGKVVFYKSRLILELRKVDKRVFSEVYRTLEIASLANKFSI
jgi:ankyrin repeat protein